MRPFSRKLQKTQQTWELGAFAKFTANGLEGRTLSELKNDLALTHNDVDLSSYSGSSSITTAGTIANGIWQGTKITDNYIDSAANWNGKQDSLTFTDTALTNNNVVLMSASANVDDIAVFKCTLKST